MTPRPLRRRLGALAAAGLAVVLAACSGGTAASADVPQLFRDHIDWLREQHPDRTFLVDALADYEVSDAEANQALTEFSTCMADFGFDAHRNLDGSGETRGNETDPALVEEEMARMQEAEQRCEVYLEVPSIQRWMRENPRGLTRIDEVRECFARNDVTVAAGISDDVLDDAIGRGCFLPADDQARLCAADPREEGFLTIAEIREMDERFRREGILMHDGATGETTQLTFGEACGPYLIE